MFSGRLGSGVVIARLADGSWSAPSCIATGGELSNVYDFEMMAKDIRAMIGVGWGFQIGAGEILVYGLRNEAD